MKKLLDRVFPERMRESDLNGESVKAAAEYIEKKHKSVPMDIVERTKITRWLAHGFYMGVRFKESQLGLVGGDETKC